MVRELESIPAHFVQAMVDLAHVFHKQHFRITNYHQTIIMHVFGLWKSGGAATTWTVQRIQTMLAQQNTPTRSAHYRGQKFRFFL